MQLTPNHLSAALSGINIRFAHVSLRRNDARSRGPVAAVQGEGLKGICAHGNAGDYLC